MTNALLFERPIWFTTRPLEFKEEAQEMEDYIYHRPVLVLESVEFLAPRPGSIVVDATCGGGGHTAELLRTGADVVALDQDPDAIAFATEKLSEYGTRVTLCQANFRETGRVLDELGIVGIGGAYAGALFVGDFYVLRLQPQPGIFEAGKLYCKGTG